MLKDANVPPHDEMLENALLGGVISYPKEFSRIEGYVSDGSIFYLNKSKALWKLIKRMIMDGEEISMPTVSASLSSSDKQIGLTPYYVSGITTDIPMVSSLESYASKIYEQHLLREIINSTTTIQQSAYDNKVSAY